MQVTLEVPDSCSTGEDAAELGRRIRLYAAVLMFQSGELSAGAACELAGVDRFTFAAECDKHGIPLVNYPAEELREELALLRSRT